MKPARKKAAKKKPAANLLRKPSPPVPVPGRSGPRLVEAQKLVLVKLLAAGETESAINGFFVLSGWERLSSSTLSYYRTLHRKAIAAAALSRIEDAAVTGLALKAERIAALKLHAEQLASIRWQPDDNGRLWNERAYRQTLADIATEMGDRKPKDTAAEQTIKVYVGLDPDKI